MQVCVGKTQQGKPILRALKPKSMFKTYSETLVNYNRNPLDILSTYTIRDVE